MKRISLCLIRCLALCGVSALYAQSSSFDRLWREVEKAEKKSLPQTVVKLADDIFRKAEAERNSPQMLKAYTWRTKYQENLTPDSFYVHLAAWERWADTASEPLDRAVLHSLIAEIYADYAADNCWQLDESTAMDDEPSADICEWSGNLFVQKVLEHTRAALQDSLLLLNTSSKTYIPFAETGETSVYYGHDMYHLLALRGTKALGDISSLADTDSDVTAAASAIFNHIIDAYRKRNNRNAMLLATLDSLNWNGKEIPPEQLDKLIEEYGNQEVCAEVYLAKAQHANRNRKYTDALRICNEAIAKYPKYKRTDALENLKREILNPHLTVHTSNQMYPQAEMVLTVNYRNLDGLTVEFHKVNLPVLSSKLKAQPDKSFYKKYCRKIDSQRLSLPRPEGYAYRDTVVTTVKAPQTGVYLMRVVAGKTGVVVENLLYITGFKVLTCAIPGNQYEAAVLDAESGKPVPDALVRLFAEKRGELTEVKALLTDKDGKVRFPRTNETDYAGYTVEKDKDTAMPLQRIEAPYMLNENVTDLSQMILLTDRALYRPGQTVYVKGIAYRSQTDTANVIAGENYTLSLTDANRRSIGEKEVHTNEFGSFTAEFVLPSGGLNGEYYLKTKRGSISIRVEEYKRPTFDIVFAPQEGTYQLGDSLRIKGTVKTYSGVPVQEAPVKYTVTRRSYTWLRLFNNDKTLLASGSVMPDEAGEFTVPFLLAGGEGVNSFFTYQVEATVTNAAGETQTSAMNIAAGNRSLLLSAKIDRLICKENAGSVVFSAVNLTDMPVNVSGEYKLFPIAALNSPTYAGTFVSNVETSLSAWQSLPSGAYKLVVSATDEQGRKADYEQEVVLFSIDDTRPPVDAKIWYYPVNTTFDASHPASFLFGTSEKDAYILMDVCSSNRRLESNVLNLSDSVMRFHYPYKEEYGDGLVISFCFVKTGQLYRQQVSLEKKLPEKELKITREVFRDKLRPGQEEEWKFIVKTPQGLPAEAEMLTFMYDASLDKIWKNNNRTFQVHYPVRLPRFNWATSYERYIHFSLWFPYIRLTVPGLVYDAFLANPLLLREIVVGYGKPSKISQVTRGYTSSMNEVSMYKKAETFPVGDVQTETADAPAEVRTHFAETAFFYPQLRTNENGEIVFSFTVPQSLTRWNFHGYAHTKGMLTGTIDGETVTSKDLMLIPNLPRFVRIGDKTSVAATVTNLTGKNLVGTVTFTLFDLQTEKVITTQKQTFTAEACKTTSASFLFTADGKQDVLGCRIVAQSGSFSDGEQHLLPVLSNQESITETLAMPMRGEEKKAFSIESLFNNNSKTATNRRLTIEFSGNPAWYAVQALPALSEPTENNTVSLTAAYYVNTLAAYIVNANPRIKTVFDAWKLRGGTKETFLSNLQKNQDVKDLLLEESPWLAEATNETERMQRIATLFDLNNIQNNNLIALTKLKDLQHTDGSWSWYKGMQGSRYVTEFTVQTLLRLSVLTGNSPDNDVRDMLQLAFNYLHKEAVKEYRRILQEEKKGDKRIGISDAALQYLYLVALSGEKIPEGDIQKAYTYFLQKISESLTTQSLSEKALSAVVLHKAGRANEAKAFIASLKEHAVQTDEQGMYFAFNKNPYSWRGLKVPTHVSVMEAFDLTGDAQSVEEMKLWLLKQKQTQQWNSPIATVDAVYALLLRGNDVSNNRGNVRITLGNTIMETLSTSSFAALGYLKETLTDGSLLNPPQKITVEKRDAGMAWGAIYAQYNEDISKVTRYGKELQVEKKLYVEKIVNNEKRLQLVTPETKLAVGDKVISRITIRLDRPMDFVQLKDQRGTCFEPIESLSGYRRSNGTGYYMTVKDASTLFFFDSLDKGVYVLEYGYRVSRSGIYEAGLAVVQSAYALEYAGHSESLKVRVE